MDEKKSVHGVWTHRWTFVLAATGSAVGLGNIWKFPYMAGENGGGAFVAMYLVFIAAIGIPVLLAETMLGRRGRQSPINTMRTLARESGTSPLWGGIGWLGVLSGFLILSFYSVVAGWAVAYVYLMVKGTFVGMSAELVDQTFTQLIGNPKAVILWHTLFMALSVAVVARGVQKGLELAVRLLMPLLFVMLAGLVVYSALQDSFKEAVEFLFHFDASRILCVAVETSDCSIDWDIIVSALGHSFFTLSIGMGAMMAYGAYMKPGLSLGKTALTVGVLDTVVALMAGLVIFTVVYQNGLEPSQGPALLFKTLPLAFGAMGQPGVVLGSIFFVLVCIAAWSSAISIIEPAAAWAVESSRLGGRVTATVLVGVVAGALGVVCIYSGEFLEFLDNLTTNVMLPLGGLLVTIFVSWVMRRSFVTKEVGMKNHTLFTGWIILVRIVAPICIVIILANRLIHWFG